MKQIYKYLTYIFIILFLIIFSIYNFEEYKNFHKKKIETKENEKKLEEDIQNFELINIKKINNIDFSYTPNSTLLTEIINKIDNSKKEIFLEVYILTEKRIQEALIKAHKRGIHIRVILEKSPYMASNINNTSFNKLEKTGIDIVWSDKNDYNLNHSKVLLIDDLSIISTGNFSYSTFTKNRDFFIFTTDKSINTKLKTNFLNDYNWDKINIYDNNLIFSPKTSRIKFEKMFNSAEKDIKMYFQYMKDDKLVEKLIQLKGEKKLKITLIIPKTAADDKNIIKLKKEGINITILPKYKMHAKAILIDERYLFIGSINMSDYSIDKNREIGILTKNNKIINDFLNIFNQDIKKGY